MERLAAEGRELRNVTPMSPAQSAAALKAATERLGEHAKLAVRYPRLILCSYRIDPNAFFERGRKSLRYCNMKCRLMSKSGQSRQIWPVSGMSAIPPIATRQATSIDVGDVPTAVVGRLVRSSHWRLSFCDQHGAWRQPHEAICGAADDPLIER